MKFTFHTTTKFYIERAIKILFDDKKSLHYLKKSFHQQQIKYTKIVKPITF